MTVISGLAMVAIVRPEGAPIPPTLERVVRASCAGAWRAVEVALAGDALRTRLVEADAKVRAGAEAVLGVVGGDVAARPDALDALRAARRAGTLDGVLDMNALAASCARVGDSPVIAAGRRRVRALAITELQRALAAHRGLAAAIGDSRIAALLVDSARAVYRYMVRQDRDLARWAVSPTGTTSRDQSLTVFAELAASNPLIEELDRLLAPDGEIAAPVVPAVPTDPPPKASEPAAIEAASVEKPVDRPAEQAAEKPSERPTEKLIEKPIAKPIAKPIEKPIEQPIARPIEQPIAKPIEQPIAKPIAKPIEKPIEQPIEKPVEKPIAKLIERPIAKPIETSIETSIEKPIETSIEQPIETSIEKPTETLIDRPKSGEPLVEASPRSSSAASEGTETAQAATASRWIVPSLLVLAILAVVIYLVR